MRRYIFVALSLLAFSAMAQGKGEVKVQETKAIVMSKTEQLQPYTGVVIDGTIDVVLRRAESVEALRAIYDQRSNSVPRVRMGIDKNGVLTISERAESQQDGEVPKVELWYTNLSKIDVSKAAVRFEDVVEGQILDMEVKSGATVEVALKVLDADVTCTGKSAIKASGEARYLDLHISNATFDGVELQTMSTRADASHEAEVVVAVSERLVAITSTSAKMLYKGEPTIIRGKNSLFGGVIERVKQ